MATAPTANDLTRQQLDELDALLQRMLTLPGSSAESTPAPAATNWRIDPPVPTLAAVTYVAPPPRPEPEPPPAPVFRAPSAPVPEPEPSVPISEFNFTNTPAPVVERKTSAVPSAPRPAPVSTPTGHTSSTANEPVPFVLYPLVGLNWAVDSALGLCGPPGLVMRSAIGKNLLGFIGLGLIAYTTAHIAQVQGWLTLPFPLPWPR